MQYLFSIILAVIISLLVVLAMVDDYIRPHTKAYNVLGRIMMALIAGLWFYMAWWGIYLN